MTRKLDRRSFLKGVGAAGAVLGFPTIIPSSAFGANERIVMGIIGAGGRGRNVMTDFHKGNTVFSAVCDVYRPNREKGIEVAKAGGAEQVTEYVDWREMLEKQKDMDAVLIATPEHQHCVQLIETVQAGYDSYCEKPMSHSIAEGNKIIKEVGKTDRIVQIGMQRRSSPFVRKGKEIFDTGVLGEVHYVRVKWHWQWSQTMNNDPIPEGDLDVKRFIYPAKRVRNFEPRMYRHWRWFWKFSGGNIVDQGTHLMDVVQWYMGEEKNPVTPIAAEQFGQVHAIPGSETPDVFSAIFDYGDFIVNWSLDYASQYQDSWSIEFLGNKAAMVLDDRGLRVFEEPWKASEDSQLVSGKPPSIHEKGGLSTLAHTNNFLECVKSREEPNAPVRIGHIAVCGPHLANVAYHKEERAFLNEDVTRVSTKGWLF